MGYRDDWFENNDSNYGWYTCQRCGKNLRKGDVDIDHIIPQSYGGDDDLNNLQCMCRSCNRSKQDDIGLHTVKDYARNTSQNTFKKLGNLFKK
jgi:5-methylcytosine-specific restriction endonuclease McrA